MNQAEVGKLLTRLRFKVHPTAGIRSPLTANRGNRGKLENARRSVTALIKNERLEYSRNTGYTVRQYTERLIQGFDVWIIGNQFRFIIIVCESQKYIVPPASTNSIFQPSSCSKTFPTSILTQHACKDKIID